MLSLTAQTKKTRVVAPFGLIVELTPQRCTERMFVCFCFDADGGVMAVQHVRLNRVCVLCCVAVTAGRPVHMMVLVVIKTNILIVQFRLIAANSSYTFLDI